MLKVSRGRRWDCRAKRYTTPSNLTWQASSKSLVKTLPSWGMRDCANCLSRRSSLNTIWRFRRTKRLSSNELTTLPSQKVTFRGRRSSDRRSSIRKEWTNWQTVWLQCAKKRRRRRSWRLCQSSQPNRTNRARRSNRWSNRSKQSLDSQLTKKSPT